MLMTYSYKSIGEEEMLNKEYPLGNLTDGWLSREALEECLESGCIYIPDSEIEDGGYLVQFDVLTIDEENILDSVVMVTGCEVW